MGKQTKVIEFVLMKLQRNFRTCQNFSIYNLIRQILYRPTAKCKENSESQTQNEFNTHVDELRGALLKMLYVYCTCTTKFNL